MSCALGGRGRSSNPEVEWAGSGQARNRFPAALPALKLAVAALAAAGEGKPVEPHLVAINPVAHNAADRVHDHDDYPLASLM